MSLKRVSPDDESFDASVKRRLNDLRTDFTEDEIRAVSKIQRAWRNVMRYATTYRLVVRYLTHGPVPKKTMAMSENELVSFLANNSVCKMTTALMDRLGSVLYRFHHKEEEFSTLVLDWHVHPQSILSLPLITFHYTTTLKSVPISFKETLFQHARLTMMWLFKLCIEIKQEKGHLAEVDEETSREFARNLYKYYRLFRKWREPFNNETGDKLLHSLQALMSAKEETGLLEEDQTIGAETDRLIRLHRKRIVLTLGRPLLQAFDQYNAMHPLKSAHFTDENTVEYAPINAKPDGLHLAHSIMLDPSFTVTKYNRSLEQSYITMRTLDIIALAHYVSMAEGLARIVPCYTRVIEAVTMFRDIILEIMTPRKKDAELGFQTNPCDETRYKVRAVVRTIAMVNDVFDIEHLAQQIRANAVTWESLLVLIGDMFTCFRDVEDCSARSIAKHERMIATTRAADHKPVALARLMYCMFTSLTAARVAEWNRRLRMTLPALVESGIKYQRDHFANKPTLQWTALSVEQAVKQVTDNATLELLVAGHPNATTRMHARWMYSIVCDPAFQLTAATCPETLRLDRISLQRIKGWVTHVTRSAVVMFTVANHLKARVPAAMFTDVRNELLGFDGVSMKPDVIAFTVRMAVKAAIDDDEALVKSTCALVAKVLADSDVFHIAMRKRITTTVMHIISKGTTPEPSSANMKPFIDALLKRTTLLFRITQINREVYREWYNPMIQAAAAKLVMTTMDID